LSEIIGVITEAMRKSWTDERLDDLSVRVETGFAQVDTRFAEVDARFDKLEGRFDRLQHTLVQVSLTMLGSVLVALFLSVR
jgi:flagellar biosynthesis/type III secretory pathway protein FliH